MFLVVPFLHREHKHAHEVSRVTRGRQSTTPVQSLIQWASVAVWEHDFLLLSWLEEDVRHLCEEYFRMGLSKHAKVVVPSAAFQEETVNVSAVLRSNLGI